ncbi:response regulator transcription factor [Erwinia aphidicola]|uniref:response regulator transcription factor n=1 Tax=Erwinia aphidicola TaxID=68334 RepID=UPI00300D9868
MAKIFIVDDHPVSQLAVKVTATANGHEVVGVCDNGRDALRALQSNQAELVVIDIDIPPPNGLEVIKRLRADGFTGGILVLSTHGEQHFIDRARSAGANGYISKDNDLDQLVDAFKAIYNGYDFFPRRALEGAAPADKVSEEGALSMLSNRELEVLGYLAKGEALIDIAEKLHVSNKSISTYKRRIMTKLGLEKTVDLLDFARRNNVV